MHFTKMANVLLLWKFLLIGFVAAEAPVTSGPPSEFTSLYKECIEGTFGVDCLQDCHCDGLCDRFTGVCNGTCEAGWIGGSCQIPDVCPSGYYGPTCSDECYCKDHCNKTTGACVSNQCTPGYKVYTTSLICEVCQGDSFGESCGQACRCEADACNKVTGECSGQCKPQWVDSYQCLAGLPDATSSKINPNTASTISCTTQISGNSTRILTVNLSREPDQVMERSIQFVDRTGVGNTEVWRFTADDIKEGDELFCLLLDQGNIVARLGINVMEYDLLVLLSPPTVGKVSASSVTTTWTAWDPDRDDGDPPVVAYIPYYKKSVSDEWIRGSVVLPGEALESEVDNLESDTVYDFDITVVREGVNGEGPRSPSVAVRTTCTVSDFLPISVEAHQNTTAMQVNISWQIPEDAACSTGISFAVYYEGNGSLQQLPEVAADSSWVIVDTAYLGSGTFTFFVEVTVDGKTAKSSWSSQIDITFPEDKQEQSPSAVVVGVVIAVLLMVVVAAGVPLVIYIVRFRKKVKTPTTPQSVPRPHYENAGVLNNADDYNMLDEDGNITQSVKYEVLNLDRKITVEDSLYDPVASPNKSVKGKNDKDRVKAVNPYGVDAVSLQSLHRKLQMPKKLMSPGMPKDRKKTQGGKVFNQPRIDGHQYENVCKR